MSAKSTPFRFRPRFIGVAFVTLSLGVMLVAAAATLTPDRMSSIFALVTGTLGIFLSFSYLRSPAWRLAVDIQEHDLVVWNGTTERLRLPWTDVQRVVVDPDREVCFVDGGSPDKSLLVPGPAAPASYTIAKRDALIEAILTHLPSHIVVESTDAIETCTTDPKA